jgi:hypothetical protein
MKKEEVMTWKWYFMKMTLKRNRWMRRQICLKTKKTAEIPKKKRLHLRKESGNYLKKINTNGYTWGKFAYSSERCPDIKAIAQTSNLKLFLSQQYFLFLFI